MKFLTKINFLNHSSFSYIFLFLNFFAWSSVLSDFGVRFYLLLLFIFVFKNYLFNPENYKSIFLNYLIILFLIYVHYIVLNILYRDSLNTELELRNLIKILIFTLLILIIFLNFETIKKNIITLSLWFIKIIIFLFFFELSLNLTLNFDHLLKQISLYNISIPCYHGLFPILKSKIFNEQSHFGMVIVGPLLIFLNHMSNNLKNYKNLITLFLITIVILLNLSITFYATTFCVYIFILFSKTKKNFKKLVTIYISLLFLWIPLLPMCGLKVIYLFKSIDDRVKFENKYLLRILDQTEDVYLQSRDGKNPKNILKIFNVLIPEKLTYLFKEKGKDFLQIPKKNIVITLSKEVGLSSAVYMNASKVTFYNFNKFIFGTGFDNYKYKFNYSINNSIRDIDIGGRKHAIRILNVNDASNNFFKGLTEFGIFWFFFITLFVYFLIKSKEFSFELKIFLLSIFISQTFFRGAGYFNGGYLILFSSFFILLAERKKNFLKNDY